MSASAPPPASPSPRTAGPTTIPPRDGRLSDRGVVRRDRVHAATWELVGVAKVLGEVDVGSVTIRGSLVVSGPLTADSCSAEGTLEVTGPVEARSSLATDGAFRAGSAVHALEADLRGDSRAAGEVRVDRRLTARGSFAAGSVRAGQLSIRGEAQVPGKVAAERIDAVLLENSAFGTIEARSVRMEARASGPIGSVMGRRAVVSVDRIEADTVELESIEVGFVRAKSLALGRGCHVGAVEGQVVRSHRSSRVGPESRSPPPPGLSR
jgi:cytoskeletal protein CcmA (bactofilin family)